MTVHVTTHLNFRGQAREALVFYQSVFGGALTIVTYEDFGQAQEAAQPGHVIWGQVVSEHGFRVMAYDVQAQKPYHPGENGFYVSLRGDGAAEVTAYWDKLAEAAKVLVPLGPAAWSPLYGMLTDRFGITWIIDVTAERPAD